MEMNKETNSQDNVSSKVRTEELEISGEKLLSKIKEIIRQGNIRRIVIKNKHQQTLMEIPMTVGVVGSLISVSLFPLFTAVGVIGSMVAQLKIVIERIE